MSKKATWMMVGLVVLSGCVPSLNAVYTDKDIVFKADVLGVWKAEQSEQTWEFRQRDETSYQLVYTDHQGHSGSFTAHLANVEGTLFLDLFPEQIEDGRPGFYQLHQVPIHTIYLVKELGDHVVLASIDYAWLDQYAKDHPTELASATFGSRRMITAPTEQLQQFLVTNKDRFKHDFQLERQTTAALK